MTWRIFARDVVAITILIALAWLLTLASDAAGF